MGSWCAENLWGAKAWNDHKLGLTVSSDEAARLFDASLRQLVSWMDCAQLDGLEATMKRMHQAEPEFLMGRIFTLGLNAMGTGRSIRTDPTFDPQLKALVEDAKKLGNVREQHHARAVQLFAHSEMESACVEWEKILAEHPNDLLAIKFAHDAYFFLGDNRGKRDGIGRVIDKWDKNAPCYSYLHGMYAFGLEECGQYEKAEQHARIGLQLQPQDCWSTHAIAHCFEMASNFEEGLKFMDSTNSDWTACNFLACHNYWHTALFHIEKGDYESALSIFDKEVLERSSKSTAMLDLVDSASLLCRFEMDGLVVGRHRWEALLRLVEPHAEDHVLVFNDAHIAMVLGRMDQEEDGEQKQKADRHLESIARYAGNGTGDNARITRDLGEQLCESVVAFNAEKYERAFDQLFPIRTQIYRIGGSHAQRDVFTQLLINAGIRCADRERRDKALEVIKEREKYKPNSALAQRLLQRHKETATTTGHGHNQQQ